MTMRITLTSLAVIAMFGITAAHASLSPSLDAGVRSATATSLLPLSATATAAQGDVAFTVARNDDGPGHEAGEHAKGHDRGDDHGGAGHQGEGHHGGEHAGRGGHR